MNAWCNTERHPRTMPSHKRLPTLYSSCLQQLHDNLYDLCERYDEATTTGDKFAEIQKINEFLTSRLPESYVVTPYHTYIPYKFTYSSKT